jgi:NAD(P)-dependent dehydrogenase (short-subunit alcohol dehydrogenase family)
LIGTYAADSDAGLPEDIAKAALFLASDDSTFDYGHALVVDGGLTHGPSLV